MIRVAAGVIVCKGRFLICQRKDTAPHPLKWEFPGGKARDGEDQDDFLDGDHLFIDSLAAGELTRLLDR